MFCYLKLVSCTLAFYYLNLIEFQPPFSAENRKKTIDKVSKLSVY